MRTVAKGMMRKIGKYWGRLIYLLVIVLGLISFRNYATDEVYSIDLQGQTHIYLGLSIVEQDFSVVLRQLNENETINNWLTSYLLQSPKPAAQVYLDYISIPKDTVYENGICLISITLSKNESIPPQITSDVTLSGVLDTPEAYIYEFPEERCVMPDQKYIMPHILLGVLPVNSYANILNWRIQEGFRAADFFPFDEQKIILEIFLKSDQVEFSPSMQVVIAQKGWEGTYNFEDPNSSVPTLHLFRSQFYKWMLIIFFFIMALIIPYLNNVVEETGSFFEVAFGLLLGLWGTHEILIPSYIETSIPIDLTVYTLYILVIVEILIVLSGQMVKKNRNSLRIVQIVNGGIDTERIILENSSIFSVNLHGWTLSDAHNSNITTFKKFKLAGRLWPFKPHRVVLWTKSTEGLENTNKRKNEHYFYGSRSAPIWQSEQDAVAILKNYRGETVFAYPYEVG